MKLWMLCCLSVTVAASLSRGNVGNVRILKYDSYHADSGAFRYDFEQSDGTWAHSQGDLVKVTNDSKEVATLVIRGNFSFVIDGFRYTVNYVADQNGYLPTINRTLESPNLDFRGVSGPILASLLGPG